MFAPLVAFFCLFMFCFVFCKKKKKMSHISITTVQSAPNETQIDQDIICSHADSLTCLPLLSNIYVLSQIINVSV